MDTRQFGSRGRAVFGAALLIVLCGWQLVVAQIPRPTDAPVPLEPAAAAKAFVLPPGFNIQLLACEPLITEPTGVCWDARGRMLVCELHGYNLEGQLEIESLNQTGKLDTEVRRVQAAEAFKEAAAAQTKGVVKLLKDSDHDGQMDQAIVWADDLPAAYGICPVRSGVLVACAPHVIYLADEDGDGECEHREILYTGFPTGMLERGINAPQWREDGWVYFGRGWSGGKITGPHLKEPVDLPNADFRLKVDGTAIEPVTGGVSTIGFAFNAVGDRFYTSTWQHVLHAAPIPWKYQLRNPHATLSQDERDCAEDRRVYPLAPVHPWKKARSNEPGWKEFYDRYGIAESAESGYFTSCCSPLILTGDLWGPGTAGTLMVCEPAQCLVHRSVLIPQGTSYRPQRVAGEEKSEFVNTTDSWFRPVALAHMPDGGVCIVDMYREIIEDYSAVPRYMQQQYGVNNGHDRGRLWRLAPSALPHRQPEDWSSGNQLAISIRLASLIPWERKTAARLLWEREPERNPQLARLAKGSQLQTLLKAFRQRPPTDAEIPKLQALDDLLTDPAIDITPLAELASQEITPRFALQLALSLGYSQRPAAEQALLELARRFGAEPWMADAICTGLNQREARFLAALVADPGAQGQAVMPALIAMVGQAGDVAALELLLERLVTADEAQLTATLPALLRAPQGTWQLTIKGEEALGQLQTRANGSENAWPVDELTVRWTSPDSYIHSSAKERALGVLQAADPAWTDQVAAARVLYGARDSSLCEPLLSAWIASTPTLQTPLWDALSVQPEWAQHVLTALRADVFGVGQLSADQREQLQQAVSEEEQAWLQEQFTALPTGVEASVFAAFEAALSAPRDVARGEQLFTKHCSACHQVGNLGKAVGPNLSGALKKPETALLQDLLTPSAAISSGYDAYLAVTTEGTQVSGLLANEGALSVTLKQASGAEVTLPRDSLESLTRSRVSLMPEGFATALAPSEAADLLAWLRTALLKDIKAP